MRLRETGVVGLLPEETAQQPTKFQRREGGKEPVTQEREIFQHGDSAVIVVGNGVTMVRHQFGNALNRQNGAG